jgi:hypothetical protein
VQGNDVDTIAADAELEIGEGGDIFKGFDERNLFQRKGDLCFLGIEGRLRDRGRRKSSGDARARAAIRWRRLDPHVKRNAALLRVEPLRFLAEKIDGLAERSFPE